VEIVEQIANPEWVHWVKRCSEVTPWPLSALFGLVVESQLMDTISAMDGLIRA
jgi:hypothetical protein